VDGDARFPDLRLLHRLLGMIDEQQRRSRRQHVRHGRLLEPVEQLTEHGRTA
jgi:hypothetical protein